MIYRTNKSIYLINELKSWLIWFVYTVLIYLLFSFLFGPFKLDTYAAVMGGLLLLRIAETIDRYNIKAIKVDQGNNQLAFKLNSMLSGSKYKTYDLMTIKSEIIKPSVLGKWLVYGLTLKVSLTKNDSFRINSRYGFSKSTLEAINTSLNS